MTKQVTSTYHTQPVKRVLQNLHSQPEGLSETEAAARLADNGPNRSAQKAARPHVNSAVIITLLASVFAFVLSAPWLGALLIVLALTAAATHRGFGLGQYLPPLPEIDTHVIRGGTVRPIRSTELVIGDIVQLTRGTTVPADLRVIEATDTLIDDTLFSGAATATARSSTAVSRGTSLLYAPNMVLAGSKVTQGSLTGVVVHTGGDTVLASAAKTLAAARPTAAQLQLARGYRLLGVTAALLYLGVLGYAITHNVSPDATLYVLILFSIALVPSSLPLARFGIAAISKRRRGTPKKLFTSPADIIQQHWQDSARSTQAATRLTYILSFSLCVMTGFGLWAARSYDVPLLVTVPQLLLVSLLAAPPLIALGFEKLPAAADAARRSLALLEALLIAGLAGVAYSTFFARRGLDPSTIPSGTPVAEQAITLVGLTVLLLFIVSVIAARNPSAGYLTKAQLRGRAFWFTLGGTLVLAVLCVSVPLIAQPLGFVAPTIADLYWTLLLALVFAAIKQFFIYDQKHHRKVVHALHKNSTAKR